MHWIIQSNLVGPGDAARLREALARLGTPYSDVKLIPVVRELDHVPKVSGPVFVYGSTFAHKSAYDQGWWPGYIGGNHSYEEMLAAHGDDLLNSDISVTTLRDLDITEPVFVRPPDDGKLFTGCVLDAPSLLELKKTVTGHAGSDHVLDEKVIVSTPKKIFAEHRCLVVNGKVVTASTYRRGGRVVYDSRVDEDITAFAQKKVNAWNPDLGFALDIAETPKGLKVIEMNALSSSGLYACDLLKFVASVNDLEHLLPSPKKNIQPTP